MPSFGRSFSRSCAAPAAAACLALASPGSGLAETAAAPDADWASYEGGAAATHYSPLAQIDRGNVSRLEVAWTYELGEGAAAANPLVVGGRMYVIGGAGAVVALDAATGAELWARPGLVSPAARGLMYWSDGGADERILYIRRDRLRAVSARDGSDVPGLDVDLRQGLERDPETVRRAASSTPGRVFENLVVLGSSPGEDYGSPLGDIRAWDVRTGALVWTFHTIPKPGEPGAETWPDDQARQRHGGVNAWGGMSVDEARGILYANTGSPTYDYWGVDRAGDNLYADCLLALDVRTGRLLWHFQMVHHDLWDYESAATPTLLTIEREGKPLDVVAVAGKTGYLYVFDRATGEPVWPIVETPAPAGGMEGEKVSPTQPIPSRPAPFAKMTFDERDVDPAIPEPERSKWIERVRSARNDGMFTPPSTRPTIQVPGNNGGANYGMTAADPAAGRFYVISSDEPAILQLTQPAAERGEGATPAERGRSIYRGHCAACHGDDRRGQPPAVPSLIGVESRLSPEQLAQAVAGGGTRMPAFPGVAGEAYSDLLTYLAHGDAAAAAPAAAAPAAAAPAAGPPPAPVDGRWRTAYGYVFYDPGDGGDWPVIAPPWSTLTAYDLHSGEKLFTTVMGDNPDYPIPEVKTGLPLTKTGFVVTGGGLLFAPTTLDRKLEAIDSATGELVWSADLPAAGLGIPSVYAVDGREYIVVPAAGTGSAGSHEPTVRPPARNAYVAYALPKDAAGTSDAGEGAP